MLDTDCLLSVYKCLDDFAVYDNLSRVNKLYNFVSNNNVLKNHKNYIRHFSHIDLYKDIAERDYEPIYNYPENIKFKRTVTRTINDLSTTISENHPILIKNPRLSGKVCEVKFNTFMTISETTSDISHIVNKLYNINNNEVVFFHPDHYYIIPCTHRCTIDIIRNNDEPIILSYDEYEYEGTINYDIQIPNLYIKSTTMFNTSMQINELSVRLTMPHYIILDHDINDIEWMGIRLFINGSNARIYLRFFHYELSEGKIIIPISKNIYLYTKLFSFPFHVFTKQHTNKIKCYTILQSNFLCGSQRDY